MKHCRQNDSLSLQETKLSRRLSTRSVGGLMGILAFVGLTACGQTGLTGDKKQGAKGAGPTAAAGAVKGDQKPVVKAGADSGAAATVVAPGAAVPGATVPGAATTAEGPAKSNLPMVEIVLEVVRYRLAETMGYNSHIFSQLLSRSGVLSSNEWMIFDSTKRLGSTPAVKPTEMLNKNRNCLVLSISDGPDVDFGCDRSADFRPFDFDTNGTIKVRKTVKVLQKNYCNKIRIKSTVHEPSASNSFSGVSTPGKTTLIDTTNVDHVRANKQWKFGGLHSTTSRGEIKDDAIGITLYTSGTPMEIQKNEPWEQHHERIELNSFRFDIKSDNMMNFSIENNGGCIDKSLLLPM